MLTLCVLSHLLVDLASGASLRTQRRLPKVTSNASNRPTSNVSLSNLHAPAVSTLFSARFTKQAPGGPAALETPPPQMFVAVFTTRSTPIEKRNSIRQLWHEVDGGMGHICARFIVCDALDNFQQSLLQEHASTGDLLFLSCQEGYAKGLLTRKVIATMRAYRQAPITKDVCLNRPLFMKVDDDTFVAGHRFREGLTLAQRNYGELLYAGVDLPSQPPERNPTSHWYEPYEVWPHANYPPAMYGGPGYILGRVMVTRIVDEGIAEANVLWNEDRAVGVWVNALQTRGVEINWIRVPGTNGFYWDTPVRSGPWGQYPYVLAHHLSEECIQCLTNVDRQNDPNFPTDQCFMLNPKPG